jgi:hypothetical protein
VSQPIGQPQGQTPQQQPGPTQPPSPPPQQEPGLLNQDPAPVSPPQPAPDAGVGGDQLAALQQQFASELDRRINQVVSTLRREMAPQPDPQVAPPPAPQPAAPVAPAQVGQSGPSPLDLQEARSVYRDFVGDQVTFLGPQEREFAQALASAEIASRIAAGERPESAGREAAGKVAGTVRELRDMYEKATVEALRKRGQLLQAAGGAPGAQPVPGQPQPGAGQGWSAGQERARQMYANRLPQTQPTESPVRS